VKFDETRTVWLQRNGRRFLRLTSVPGPVFSIGCDVSPQRIDTDPKRHSPTRASNIRSIAPVPLVLTQIALLPRLAPIASSVSESVYTGNVCFFKLEGPERYAEGSEAH
jgi:hypothetical protein